MRAALVTVLLIGACSGTGGPSILDAITRPAQTAVGRLVQQKKQLLARFPFLVVFKQD